MNSTNVKWSRTGTPNIWMTVGFRVSWDRTPQRPVAVFAQTEESCSCLSCPAHSIGLMGTPNGFLLPERRSKLFGNQRHHRW